MKLYGAEEKQSLSKIGKRLKVIRGIRELTLQEVADTLGCTKQRISLFETGNNVPSIGSLLAFCKMYNTTPNTLLGFNERLENYLLEIVRMKEEFKDKGL